MEQFENVRAEKKANVYFEGKVSSRTIFLADGRRVTLGLMLPGVYKFSTNQNELMDITTGEMEVRLPESDWFTVAGGENFRVPAGQEFEVRARSLVDYCCYYS